MTSQSQPSSPHHVVFSAHSKTGLGPALRDLKDGMMHTSVWLAFAWNEIQRRYRRSILGLSWIVLSYFFFVGAIALFFGGFSAKDSGAFTCYVAVGYAAFTFIISNITDGCAAFTSSATWIKSTPLPYSIYIYKGISRSLFILAIQLIAAFMILPFMGWRPNWTLFDALPALALFLINAISIQLFFGLVGARWRDITHLISAVTRILFFTTPILWVFEERTGIRRQFASANPLTHFLEIFRAPLLGEHASPESWAIAVIWTLIGIVAALTAASLMQRRLPFWV